MLGVAPKEGPIELTPAEAVTAISVLAVVAAGLEISDELGNKIMEVMTIKNCAQSFL
ncbi:MAG: hypothetical protein P2A85_12430 [Microcoleus anatoxicus]|uniref:hypothetical protein n=1 Tax=Microcoleus anatoxicus TaxID=2705319 RepID=UPI00366AB6F0